MFACCGGLSTLSGKRLISCRFLEPADFSGNHRVAVVHHGLSDANVGHHDRRRENFPPPANFVIAIRVEHVPDIAVGERELDEVHARVS
jgi:hypothetical protein